MKKEGFIEDEIDKNAKGANIDSLKKSREYRRLFVQKYGCILSSILRHDRSDKTIDFSKQNRDYTSKTDFGSFVWRRGTGSRLSKKEKAALSIFPQNVGRAITKFYCPENGIVYDPFAGHNSRMQLVWESGRNYIGVDISKEFMENNRKIRDVLFNRDKKGFFKNSAKITLIEGSSDQVNLPDSYADFTITSPPYWDIEYYGDEEKQLGKYKKYEDFLKAIYKHIKENYRILKADSFCCWFVNDFRKEGVFYPYHSDLIPYFREAGFVLFSIYIIDLGNTLGEIFIQNVEKTKIFPKRHEYCLVFQKP